MPEAHLGRSCHNALVEGNRERIGHILVCVVAYFLVFAVALLVLGMPQPNVDSYSSTWALYICIMPALLPHLLLGWVGFVGAHLWLTRRRRSSSTLKRGRGL